LILRNDLSSATRVILVCSDRFRIANQYTKPNPQMRSQPVQQNDDTVAKGRLRKRYDPQHGDARSGRTYRLLSPCIRKTGIIAS
jgi:hypothetical protein